MEPDLLEAKGALLDSVDPAAWLELADSYIELFNKNPKVFRLPKDHVKLKPLIENFAYDMDGFVDFVLSVRNEASKQQYKGIHEFYRRVVVRRTQQQRRRRLTQGVRQIEEDLGMRFSADQVSRVSVWLEQYWGKERMDRLDEARSHTSGGRISTDVRTEICDAFWAEVDKGLNEGIVPIPPEIVYVERKGSSMEPH